MFCAVVILWLVGGGGRATNGEVEGIGESGHFPWGVSASDLMKTTTYIKMFRERI
jgi:hypothetical protein